MARHNLNILFRLYKAQTNKKDETPIYLRLSYGKNRKNLSTGFTVQQERWDGSKGKVKGAKEDAININKYISHTKARLMELLNEMVNEGDMDLEALQHKFFGKDVDNRTLLDLVTYHNADFKSRIGTDYTESTFEKYDILHRKLIDFIPYKYGKKDIRLKDLTVKFMADFDFYLKNHDKKTNIIQQQST